MIRYNYYPFDRKVNDINFYDLTSLNWNDFKFTRGVRYYTLTKNDVEKFYNLTEREYGTLVNEDFIYFVNKIPDPTELKVGQEIILPNYQDVRDFLVSQLGIIS